VAAWALWALTLLGLSASVWLDHLSHQAGRPDLAEEFPDTFLGPMLALVSAATVGAVLATRRPRHPVGWLLLALGLSLMAGGLGAAYTGYGLLARPGALPATHVVARHWTATTVIAQTVLSFVLLLIPTGSLHTSLALVGLEDRGRSGQLAGDPGGSQRIDGPAISGDR
jgi:hypothetical protein